VTNPFHPLYGSELEVIVCRLNWGEERVYFRDDAGELQSIVARCTDVAGIDVFVEVAAGRSHFRYEDLVRLADLVEEVG
jgi:hypothetical protein